MNELFTPLEPPPGGLKALRRRLDRPRRWPVVTVALAVAAALLLRPAPMPDLQDPAFAALFTDAAPAVQLRGPGALTPVVTQGDVLVYRVMVLPRPADPR